MSAGGPLAERQILERVLRFRGERGLPGTAFTTEEGSSQYLVTANHLTTGDPDENVSIGNFGFDERHLLLSRVDDPLEHGQDVAVFVLEDEVASCAPLPLSSAGLMLSHDILIAGFPAGLEQTWINDGAADSRNMGGTPGRIPTERFPMLKRGIVGWMGSLSGQHVFLLDVLANFGFSGGPVVFRERETSQIRVAGIVSSTFSQTNSVRGIAEREYAGISVAAFTDTAVRAIAKHQAGEAGPRALR